MVSPTGVAPSDEAFPAGDAVGELYPGTTRNFSVDPVSSEVAKSKDLKEQAEEKEERKEAAVHKLKSTVIITGVVVAVIGAVFAITKKLRET